MPVVGRCEGSFLGIECPRGELDRRDTDFWPIRDLTGAISISGGWVACAYEVRRDDPTNSMQPHSDSSRLHPHDVGYLGRGKVLPSGQLDDLSILGA